MNAASLIEWLQNYRWPELWQEVRHFKPQAAPACTPELALKAMLLVGWWQEREMAQQCLLSYPKAVADPLTHFALCYTALCLGDTARYRALLQAVPPKQTAWMRHWLNLEAIGRAGQTLEQTRLAKRLTPAGQAPASWIWVALLQSNEGPKQNITPLREWLQSLPAPVQRTDLARALAARCGLPEAYLDGQGNPEPLESMPAPVLYRHAHRLFSERQLPEVLHAYDTLARSQFVDIVTLQNWLSLGSSIPQGYSGMPERVQYAINLVPQNLAIQGTVAAYALIAAWLRGDFPRCEAIAGHFLGYLKLPKSSSLLIRSTQIFFLYITQLTRFRQQNSALYLPSEPFYPSDTLVVVGDSHALSPAHLYSQWLDRPCKTLSAFIMGVKMHHLANPASSYLGEAARLQLDALKSKTVHLLVTIGEIDCRPDEGLWPVHRKTSQPLDALIERTVTGYIDFLQRTLVDHQLLSITVQGVPAPGYAFEDDKDPGDIPGFVAMIRAVNDCLRAKTLAAGFNFLDVHAATVGEDGRGNGRWYLDGCHLSPAYYRQAQEWLLTPN